MGLYRQSARHAQTRHEQPQVRPAARYGRPLRPLVLAWLLVLPNWLPMTAFAAQADKGAELLEPVAEPMTNARLGIILKRLDPQLRGGPGNWIVRFAEQTAQVVTDESADRMRIMVPIVDASTLSKEQLYRIMQANFESALDARYAVAEGTVWSVYIHPLAALDENELVSGIAQTFNAAQTFGGSYSSGLFSFGGGDNSEAFDAIIEKGTSI